MKDMPTVTITADELRQRYAALVDEADAILTKAEDEDRNFTDDEQNAYDDKLNEIDGLRTRIERAERQEQMNKETRSPANRGIRPDPNDQAGGVRVTHDPADNPFRSFGEQLQAVYRASQPGAEIDKRLLAIQHRAASGASEGDMGDGGFLVQEDFATELFRRTYQTGILASRARRIPISGASNALKMNKVDETSRANGSRWGGIQAYWSGEAASMTASQPKFKRLQIELEKLTGLLYATDELLADGTALEAVIMEGFSEEFGFKLDDAMLNGTGAGLPLGILNSDALVTVAKETSQAASTILAENITKMWSRLWGPSRARAAWYINQDVEPQLAALTIPVKNVAGTENVGGIPVYMPANGLSQSPFSTLYGRPVIPVEQCATLGTVGDVVFGDFSQYLLIEKGGLQRASSIHVKFTTGETAFRFVMRVNGRPLWDSALTPYKGSNTLSPFVALATRS